MNFKTQKLYEYISNLVTKHGKIDEDEVRKTAYKYAWKIGFKDPFCIMIEISKDMAILRDSVRRPGEDFQKITLKDVYERRRQERQ